MRTIIEIDLIDVKRVKMDNGNVGIELSNDVHLVLTPHTIKYISGCIDNLYKKQLEGELNDDNN